MCVPVAEGSTRFVVTPVVGGSFAEGWRWAVPDAMRGCIGQVLAVRGRGAARRKEWVDSGLYDFRAGCLIYNRASGSRMALDMAGQTTTYAVQVEDAAPTTGRAQGYVSYRWYRLYAGELHRMDLGLQTCSQAEFVRRLREGMSPPAEGKGVNDVQRCSAKLEDDVPATA